MIRGVVTANREAVISLAVRGPASIEQQIEVVVDTGFDGWLTLAPALIALLELPWRRRGRVLLADGSECVFDIYEARWSGMGSRDESLWMKQARRRWSAWRCSRATS